MEVAAILPAAVGVSGPGSIAVPYVADKAAPELRMLEEP